MPLDPTPVEMPVTLVGDRTATTSSDVTRLLREWDQHANPAAELLPLVYAQLHAMARNRMRRERAGHTLQATALVHEAYMKLMEINGGAPAFADRSRFFVAAAEAMRRILIDHARKRSSAKRGGGAVRISLDDIQAESTSEAGKLADADRLVALGESLDVLESEDPRAAEVVKLRYFAGLSAEETAQALEISERTVHREWSYARARLLELLDRH
jgi:RNA polymerase sigma factor (TIGR02999 family)